MQNVFTPSVHSEFSVKRNPSLISGKFYYDDANGLYQYFYHAINIVDYPGYPQLKNTWVYKNLEPAKYNTMASNLAQKGREVEADKAHEVVKSAREIAPASSPSAYQPQSPAIDIAPPSKPQKQAETEVNYLPWVIGGGVLTLGLGLAIVFLPIRKKPVS